MKRSAPGSRATCPLGVTTRTSTVPAPTGATAAIDVVSEVTVKSDEALAPKSTALAPVNPDPEMSTVSPPPAVPLAGLSALTDTGAGAATATEGASMRVPSTTRTPNITVHGVRTGVVILSPRVACSRIKL